MAQLGPAHADTLRSRSNLAGFMGEAGDPSALEIMEEVIALQEVHCGEKHTDTLVTRGNHAELRVLTGVDTDAAGRALESVIASLREQTKEIDINVLYFRSALALLWQKQGKVKQAEAVYREVLASAATVGLGCDCHGVATL